MVAGLPTRYRSAYFRGRDEIDDLPEGSSRFAPMMAEAQMRSWFRLLRRQAFTVFVMVLAVGCGGIQNINQFASAPAHQGSVEIRAVPQSSTGTLLFEMRVENPAGTTGIPSGSLL